MDVALRSQLKTETRWLSGLALLGEHALSLALLAAFFSSTFLVRTSQLQQFILPLQSLGLAIACFASAAYSRSETRRQARTVCALPLGINRLFLVAAALLIWLPVGQFLNQHRSGPILDDRLMAVAALTTLAVGLSQVLMAMISRPIQRILEPLPIRYLHACIALTSFLLLFPLLAEHLPILMLISSVLLLRRFTNLPLPFHIPAPLAALGLGFLVAIGNGWTKIDELPQLTSPLAMLASAIHQPNQLWSNWQTMLSEENGLIRWIPSTLALTLQVALLDLALIQRSCTFDEPPRKGRERREGPRTFPSVDKKLFLLGLLNCALGIIGLPCPINVLVGHQAHQDAKSGAAYVQLSALLLFVLGITGTVGWAVSVWPEYLWVPFVAIIYVSTFNSEIETGQTSNAGLLASGLPISAAVVALAPLLAALWGGSSPQTTSSSLANPIFHISGLVDFGEGCVLTSLIWGSVVVNLSAAASKRHDVNELGLTKASVLCAWGLVACLLGLIHSAQIGFQLEPISVGYLGLAVMLHWAHILNVHRQKATVNRIQESLLESESVPSEADISHILNVDPRTLLASPESAPSPE